MDGHTPQNPFAKSEPCAAGAACRPMAPRYALVTPVRNEEATIGRTIETVAEQTIAPLAWVIVSDGSTDATDAIVREWAARLPWLHFVRRDSAPNRRDFAAKITAFGQGHETLKALAPEHEYVGNLDADVTFAPDYYEKALALFAAFPGLGIIGGTIMEDMGQGFKKQLSSARHTPGATQLFRREVFEAIGGYLPLPHGGEDSAADIMARMHGWECAAYDELEVFHHRRVGGTGWRGLLRARYLAGVTDYNLGKHPLFVAAKSLARLGEDPPLLASAARLAGFAIASLRRPARPVSADFIAFIRQDEMRMLLPWGRLPARQEVG